MSDCHREEDDVLLHTRAAFQIVCLLERGLPVGAAVGVTLHGVLISEASW